MTDGHFRVSVDETRHLITIRMRGQEPSAFYTERLLRAYDPIDRPWTYKRLLDYRHFKGLIATDDINRLAAKWALLTEGQSYNSQIAVITEDALTPARVSGFRHLFPHDEIRSFQTLRTALAWLYKDEETVRSGVEQIE